VDKWKSGLKRDRARKPERGSAPEDTTNGKPKKAKEC